MHIEICMPSPKVYREVMWRDDARGVTYENDGWR
jgi:hypothetical protein